MQGIEEDIFKRENIMEKKSAEIKNLERIIDSYAKKIKKNTAEKD